MSMSQLALFYLANCKCIHIGVYNLGIYLFYILINTIWRVVFIYCEFVLLFSLKSSPVISYIDTHFSFT